MKRMSYTEKQRRFWRHFAFFGIALLSIGVLLVLFGFDLYWQRDVADGRVVGLTRAGHFASGRAGESFVDDSRHIVDFKVDGKVWSVGVTGYNIGNTVQITYYRRWPQIAGVGSRHTWVLSLGGAFVCCGVFCLVARRIWGGA